MSERTETEGTCPACGEYVPDVRNCGCEQSRAANDQPTTGIPFDVLVQCHEACTHEISFWRIIGPMREPRSPTKEAFIAIRDKMFAAELEKKPNIIGLQQQSPIDETAPKSMFDNKRSAIDFIHYHGTKAALEYFVQLAADEIVSATHDASQGATPDNE